MWRYTGCVSFVAGGYSYPLVAGMVSYDHRLSGSETSCSLIWQRRLLRWVEFGADDVSHRWHCHWATSCRSLSVSRYSSISASSFCDLGRRRQRSASESATASYQHLANEPLTHHQPRFMEYRYGPNLFNSLSCFSTPELNYIVWRRMHYGMNNLLNVVTQQRFDRARV